MSPGAFDGVGYVFSTDDPYFGIDLDSCIAPDGAFLPWGPELRGKLADAPSVPDALVLIKQLATYAEISPSGAGVKLVGIGKPPGMLCTIGGKRIGEIGFYYKSRYFCMTGHRVPGTPAEPTQCQVALDKLYHAVHGRPKRATGGSSGATGSNGQRSDEEILEHLFRSRAGDKAKRLFDGDTSGYPSGSEADMAAACYLAFWSRDPEQIERLMRGSGLKRDKWDREDYLPRTIERALGMVTEFYAWERKGARGDYASGEQIGNARVRGESVVPIPMSDIITAVKQGCEDWPRRVENALFTHEPEEGVCWLDAPASLFGWLSRHHGIIEWRRNIGCVTKEEFFAELVRTAPRYDAIEELPHEPPVQGHYYACPKIEPGDGKALRTFLDFFSHEGAIDWELHTAIAATPLWGGPPGARPAAMVTSTTGRGKGKSKTAQFTARLFGGFIDVSANEEITGLKQRLLTKEALLRRVALLDNVKTMRFSWAELESIITTDIISGKRLYYGEATRPNYLTWIITLNSASLSTDMAQRVVEIKLADPEYTETWEEELSAFVASNRQGIIADLIAFLRRPPKRLKRYSRWASWESQVLSKTENPDRCLDAILERRGQVDVEEEEGGIIEDYFAAKLRWLGYDLERDDVSIPNAYAARWFNQATGDNRRVAGVTRTLKQLHDEGKITRIMPARMGGTGGRGFRWVGESVTEEEPIRRDLGHRIREKVKGGQDSEHEEDFWGENRDGCDRCDTFWPFFSFTWMIHAREEGEDVGEENRKKVSQVSPRIEPMKPTALPSPSELRTRYAKGRRERQAAEPMPEPDWAAERRLPSLETLERLSRPGSDR